MRSSSLLLLAPLAALAAACGSSASPKPTFQLPVGDNVLPVSVDGSRCRGAPYVNEPCVSVKVCSPGTSTCQTIDGLLLDTGSYGLRVFKQAFDPAVVTSLPAVAAPGGGSLAECVQYADLSADWGPVVTADVVLGNEPAVRVPIQVIDATYGVVPPTCPTPETAPVSFNGILGVGVFAEDCGPSCPAAANLYFSWNGTASTAVAVDASVQVLNPVAALPLDNNGVIVALPGVSSAGAPSVDGALVLGIGTRTNNRPVSASAIALDVHGNFQTTLDGGTVLSGSFADTGSNGLFFAPPSAITACTSATGWYCPSAPLAFGASNGPSPGYPGNHLRVTFQIANLEALATRNAVFANVGGSAVQNAGFDWGLPFFLGRTVYLGIAGRTTAFGNGPTLAY
jgi:hypothetical protein